jgi:hypothetical protein
MVTYNHGYYWADMVNQVANYVQNGYAAVITVSGANDIETSWSPFDSGLGNAARRWIDGWEQSAAHVYYDFGDAVACPQSSSGNSYCNSPDWYMYGVWYKTFGAGKAFSFPEIYVFPPGNPNGPVDAKRWTNLSRNAASGVFDPAHPQAIVMYGSLTNWCFKYEATCPPNGNPSENTPAQGWTELYNELNANPATQANPPWSSDIRYSP